MQAVQVLDWPAGPKLTSIPRPQHSNSDATAHVQVKAVGLHQLVKTKATGKHFTSGPLPHTPGVDGVGVETKTGKTVYFQTYNAPHGTGTFREYVDIPRECICEMPSGLDPVLAAGLMNPVMSSWMALKTRAGELPKDWTCLVLGATSMSGRLAVQVARKMGAGKIYGAARRKGALAEVPGLDEHIVLNSESMDETAFGEASWVDVVIDYLYGPWPKIVLSQAARGAGPLTWLSIGNMAGAEASIPGPALRARDVTIRGSGPGSWMPSRMDEREMKGMLGVILENQESVQDGVKSFDIESVEDIWGSKQKERVVFVFGKNR